MVFSAEDSAKKPSPSGSPPQGHVDMIDESECLVSVADTVLHVDWAPVSTGTLSIYKSVLSWRDTDKNVSFFLQYPNISLHAIRNDPFPGLYAMLDHKLHLPAGLALPAAPASAENMDDDGDEEEDEITELMFQPQDPAIVPILYSAMNECQALHPDPNDSADSEEEGDDDDEFDPNDIEIEEVEVAQEVFQVLQIEDQNGYQNGAAFDPDQFADDDDND